MLPPRLRSLPSWAVYLVLGVAVTGAITTSSHASWATWGATAVQASAGLAIIYGIRRNRPDRPLFWWLLAGGQLLYASAQGAWRIPFEGWRGLIPFGDFTDVLYLSALVVFIGALAVGPRALTGRSAWTGTLDGAAVVLGLAFGTWNLIAQPYIASGRLDDWGIAVFLTYEGFEVLRMALLARIVLAGGLAQGGWLMAVGMLVQLSADLLYGVTLLAPSGWPDSVQNAGWIIGSVCIGAAGLHPGRRVAQADDRDSEETLSRLRLTVFLLLLLIYPVTVCLNAVTGAGDLRSKEFLANTMLPVLLVVAVAGVLLIRLGLLTTVAQRRTVQMREALTTGDVLRARLSHEATHDPLTGLANRAVLTDSLTAALAGGCPGSLLLIDLDGFKEVNDLHGHPVGDALLCQVADRLRRVAGDAVAARLGGDEFAILTSQPIDAALAEQVVRELAAPYPLGDLQLAVTSSVGARGLADGRTAAEVLRDVDLALYAAKADGRACVVRFHADLRAAWVRQTKISQGLRAALLGDGLALHYQPIVDLRTGRITAFESLMRWTPPGEAAVPPAEFIPVAERTGLIGDLGLWALRTACADARPWFERYGVGVTVNVSAHQLDDPDFCVQVLDALRTCGLPGRALTLEITESMLVGAAGAMSETVTDTLQVLRAQGIRIAIDDFGTGYSSLAYLHQLPVDVLKLDRSLTLGGEPTAQQTAIARAVIDLGNGLELQTVAEGIETAGQAAQLRDLGSPRAQGYFFGRPMPADAVPAALADANAPADALV